MGAWVFYLMHTIHGIRGVKHVTVQSFLVFYSYRYFNEVTSGKVFNPSSPSPYSPSPTRRSLSPSPALLATVGYPPSSPLRGRTQSFGAYSHAIHPANPHLQSMSATHVGVVGPSPVTHNSNSGGTSHSVS
jgi:hypothetical protein